MFYNQWEGYEIEWTKHTWHSNFESCWRHTNNILDFEIDYPTNYEIKEWFVNIDTIGNDILLTQYIKEVESQYLTTLQII